jgi:hypothetical protein
LPSDASQLRKCLPVYQLEGFPTCELEGISRESTRRYQDPPVRALGGHDPQELADALDRHLAVLPMLALDHDALAAAGKLKVNSAVRLRSATLGDGKALPTVGFPNQPLKICPIELADGFEAVRPRQ